MNNIKLLKMHIRKNPKKRGDLLFIEFDNDTMWSPTMKELARIIWVLYYIEERKYPRNMGYMGGGKFLQFCYDVIEKIPAGNEERLDVSDFNEKKFNSICKKNKLK